jgi:hypothetical protein
MKRYLVKGEDVSECQNCRRRFSESLLINPIPHFWERVSPGEIVPSGECPKCGALCHQIFPKSKRR